MSATTDIRAFIAGKDGQTFTTSQLAEHCEASINAIYAALSKMAISGELIRIDTGKYLVPESTPSTTKQEFADSDEVVVVAPPRKAAVPKTRPGIDIGVFSNGRIVISRGSVVLELDMHEAEDMMQFLARWNS